jgi:hypothetical protein
MDLDKDLLDTTQLLIWCFSIGKESDHTKELLAQFSKTKKISLNNNSYNELKEKTKQSFPTKVINFFFFFYFVDDSS